ncbi:hypothetical protein DPMN_087516 [Dreissena polymorpha]|uniref:Uncharacterized protein n=1 Tax=Dreissena polymorpha TaxID=45954 RepID=A0A9D4KSU3_DREPO|nr:hypothetical protein DPMN_087516 [Dreissena polymorpha]
MYCAGTNEELASPAPLPSFITSPGNLPSMIAGSPPPTTPTNVPQSVNVTMTTTGAGLTHSPGSPVPVDGQATSSSQGLQYSASFQKVTAPGRAAYTNLHGNFYCPLPVKPEGTYGSHSVCLSVCLSVSPSHFSGSCGNFKSSSYIFMKLETWIDGNMEIMRVISFCSYVKNSGCYGNK